MARNEDVSRTAVLASALYLLFLVALSVLLAYFGRRDLLTLSSSYVAILKAQQESARRLQQQTWLRTGQS